MDQPARRVAYGSLNSECWCLKLVDTFRNVLCVRWLSYWPTALRPARRLSFQHLQIVFQIEELLPVSITALMPCHASAVVPHLHVGRQYAGPHCGSGLDRRRVEVVPHPDTAFTVDFVESCPRPEGILRPITPADAVVRSASLHPPSAPGRRSCAPRRLVNRPAPVRSDPPGLELSAPAPGDCAGSSRLRPPHPLSHGLRQGYRTPPETSSAIETR